MSERGRWSVCGRRLLWSSGVGRLRSSIEPCVAGLLDLGVLVSLSVAVVWERWQTGSLRGRLWSYVPGRPELNTPCWPGRVATWFVIAAMLGGRRGAGAAAASRCAETWAWSHSLVSMCSIAARRESNPLIRSSMLASSDEGSRGWRG